MFDFFNGSKVTTDAPPRRIYRFRWTVEYRKFVPSGTPGAIPSDASPPYFSEFETYEFVSQLLQPSPLFFTHQLSLEPRHKARRKGGWERHVSNRPIELING